MGLRLLDAFCVRRVDFDGLDTLSGAGVTLIEREAADQKERACDFDQ
jgi:hypothetical protein